MWNLPADTNSTSAAEIPASVLAVSQEAAPTALQGASPTAHERTLLNTHQTPARVASGNVACTGLTASESPAMITALPIGKGCIVNV
jgi:hypothetical protein